MELPLFQVDAFTPVLFKGNPAAVMPLESWLPDETLQSIAAENQLSETAFFVASDNTDVDFELRWFTPATEVPLCGHATLASAWVLFNKLGWQSDEVRFHSRSGPLAVRKRVDGRLTLDFPNLPFEQHATPELLREALPGAGSHVIFVPNDTNYMVVFTSEQDVIDSAPDMTKLKQLGNQGVIVTAPGDGEHYDFVSRYFAPGAGIDEDPVTGSIHSVLAPYWSERLGKTTLEARQRSARGGELLCELEGDRVLISGHCAFFLSGTVSLAHLD